MSKKLLHKLVYILKKDYYINIYKLYTEYEHLIHFYANSGLFLTSIDKKTIDDGQKYYEFTTNIIEKDLEIRLNEDNIKNYIFTIYL